MPLTPLQEAINLLERARVYLYPRGEEEPEVGQLLDKIEEFIQQNEIIDTNNTPL